MGTGPTTLKAVQPIVTHVQPLAGGMTTVNPRTVRGLLPGERPDATYLRDDLANFGVTNRPDVRLGCIGPLAAGYTWQQGKEPSVVRLKGEPALQKLLDGLGESDIALQKSDSQYIPGIEAESGVHVEGIDRQILRIRGLAWSVTNGTDEDVIPFRSAVKTLAASLPNLLKVANGIAANLGDDHSPIIQQVAQSVVEQLESLIDKFSAMDIDTVDYQQLADFFSNSFSWRMTSSFSAEGSSTAIVIRTSPFLHETAYTLLDFLAHHGKLIRTDEHGHGAVFELPLEKAFWTRESSFTRAEFSAVLRLLGWGMMSKRAQAVDSTNTNDGKKPWWTTLKTTTRQLAFFHVHLDFSAGSGLPESL